MKKITILSGLLLLIGLAAHAQEKVTEYYVRPAVVVRTPIQGDSINFIGKKFVSDDLLKTKISLDFDRHSYETMSADTTGYVAVEKADKDNHLLSVFYQSACRTVYERYAESILSGTI